MTATGDRRRARLAGARLYLIVTPAALPADWERRLAAALATGCVGAVQLRLKDTPPEAVLATARRLGRRAADGGALFVLNDAVALAVEADADGAHVGADDLDPGAARAVLGPDRLLGVSAHGAEELAAARGRGADYAGLGPCFATRSKALERPPGGAALLARALPAAGPLPVFPIGGIDPGRAPALVAAGATRLAVGAGVLAAEDPAAAARFLHRLVDRSVAARGTP